MNLRGPMIEVQVPMKMVELAAIVGVLDLFKSLAPPPKTDLDLGFSRRLDEIREKFYRRIQEGR